MPYDEITELPKGVRNNLPEPAQEIYKKAFNGSANIILPSVPIGFGDLPAAPSWRTWSCSRGSDRILGEKLSAPSER